MSDEQRHRIGASRIGIPIDEYRRQIEAGQKWCSPHAGWHPRAEFGASRATYDGLAGSCLASMRVNRRQQRQEASS